MTTSQTIVSLLIPIVTCSPHSEKALCFLWHHCSLDTLMSLYLTPSRNLNLVTWIFMSQMTLCMCAWLICMTHMTPTTLSALLHLKSTSRQVDYMQAFLQAPLDDDISMCILQGWYFDLMTEQLVQKSTDPCSHDKDHFIRLKHNLYSVKQAARNWFLHLKKGLLSHGFT